MTTSKHEFQRSFAVIIGIDEYDDPGISNLETAVADAQKLAEIIGTRHKELKEKYQEENTYKVKSLINPTKGQLEELLDDFKEGKISIDNEKKEITKNDRLLFYFAGHGKALDALDNQDGPVGYFIPKDAKEDNTSSYLAMQDLYDALIELECRHMLAILDCCYAAAFNWAVRDVKSPVKLYKERYDRFIEDRAWQVITSAAHNQEAWDSPKARGKIRYGEKLHSPFAAALFTALSWEPDQTKSEESNQQNPDANKDYIITASELYLHLQETVSSYTDQNFKRQTPGYCPLKKHQAGEFIFLLKGFDRDNLDDAPPLNLENNPYRGLSSYEYNKRDRDLFFGREELITKLKEKINFEGRNPEKEVAENAQIIKSEQVPSENNQSSSIGNGLTLVLGASGTGKSSLVKAGLLPRLEEEGRFTIITPMRPEENPVQSLAKVFLPIINTEAEKELEITQELEDDTYAVQDIINTVDTANKNNNDKSRNNKLLKAIDQLKLTKEQQKYLEDYSDSESIDNDKQEKIKQWLNKYEERTQLHTVRPRKNPIQYLAKVFSEIVNRNANKKLKLTQELEDEKDAVKNIINTVDITHNNSNTKLLQAVEQLKLTEQQEKDLKNEYSNSESIDADRQEKIKQWLDNYDKREKLHQENQKKLEDLIEKLQNKKNGISGFSKLIKEWGEKNKDKKLLLVIDQFEELITLSKGNNNKEKDKEQQQFELLLKDVIEKCSDIFHVIIILRIDFEPQLQNSPLYKFFKENKFRFVIEPITQDEIRKIIKEPAEKKAIFFEPPELVERLINEVVQMPGALPLLSFTLNELYLKFVDNKKDNRVISEKDYEDIGGVVGSLTSSANKIYDELVKKDTHYKKTIRKVMLRMVAVSGNELARRRAFLSEFEYEENKESERVQKVLEKFVEARLLVKGKNSEDKPYIEPAHDCLVTGWDKLIQWKNEKLDTLILQQRLKPAIDDWQKIKNEEEKNQLILLKSLSQTEFYIIDRIQSGKLKRQYKIKPSLIKKALESSVKNSESNTGTEITTHNGQNGKKTNTKSGQYLWHNNPRLSQLSEMLVSEDKWLSKDEDRFVRHSIVKQGRNNFWKINLVGCIAFIMFAFGVSALLGQREAKIGEIRALRESAEADLKSNNDLEATLNILRAKKGLEELGSSPLEILTFGFLPGTTEEREIQAALHQVYYETKESNRISLNHGSVYRVALSPDNKKLATVGLRGTLTLWDTSDPSDIKLQKQFKTEQTYVRAVVFHPTDSNIFATAGLRGDIKLWKIDFKGDFIDWKTEDNQLKPAQLSTDSNIINSIAFINDDKIATVERNINDYSRVIIRIRDTSSGDADDELTLETTRRIFISLVTFKDKKLLAIARGDNKVILCPIQLQETSAQLCDEKELEENTHSIDNKTIRSVASDQNGNLAITDEDGKIKIYSIEEKNSKISLDTLKPKEIPSSEGTIRHVALNKDFLATIGNNFQLVLRNRLDNNKEIDTPKLPVEISRNNSVALSPDGSLLATAGEDGYVRLWGSSGKLERQIRTHYGNVRSVTFIPEQTQKQLPDQNKTLILTGGDDNKVKLWDTSSGKRLDQTPRQSSDIISVVFIPNQPEQFATFAKDGNYKIWEISLDEKSNYKIEESRIPYTTTKLKDYKSAAFTPKGNEVFTLGENGKIKIWDNPQKSIDLLKNFKPVINSFTLTPDGQQVVIGDKEGIVWLWNGKGQPRRFLSTQQGSIDALAMTPDEKLVTVGEDGTLRIWDISKKQVQLPQIQKVETLAFNSDSTKLVTVENDKVKLWDTFGNLLKHIPSQPIDNARSLAFSSDGKFLAVAGKDDKDDTVKLLDTNGNKLDQIQIPQGVINNLSFDNDDNLLVITEEKKTIVYKIKINADTSNDSNASNPKLLLEKKPVVSGTKVALSKNSNTVAYVEKKDNSKVILKNSSEKEFLTQQGGITSLALSDDGELLATAGEDGTLLLENTKSGSREFDKIPALQGEITNVIFSPDSNLIATIGTKEESKDKKEKTVKLWQITGEKNKLRPFKTFKNVSNLAFSPDNKLLATVGTDKKIELFKLGTEDLLAKVCSSVRNYLQNSKGLESSDRNLCDYVDEENGTSDILTTQNTTDGTNPTPTPRSSTDKTSYGDKILVEGLTNSDRKLAKQAFIDGNFDKAKNYLQASLNKNPNDPEALIYLNNAKIATQVSHTIAVPVPITNNPDSALEILRGVAQAQDEINNNGGINGVGLRILIADDENNPQFGEEIAQQLVKKSEVLGIVGHHASGVALKAGKIYNNQNLPAILPVSTSVELSKLLGKSIFRTVPSDNQSAKKLADYMLNEINKQKAVVVYNSQSNYSESLKSVFEQAVTSQRIVDTIDLSQDDVKIDSINNKADVIVLLPDTEKLEPALEVVKANEGNLPVLAGDDVYSSKTLELGQQNAENMVVAVPWDIDANPNLEFTRQSQKLWRADINWRTAMSYDATRVLVAAIEQNSTREGVAKALRSNSFQIDNGKLANGNIRFDENGDRAQPNIQFVKVKSDSKSQHGYDFKPIP
ncbi:MAG: ABC transporter substrate-binding protein [Cyanobacteria bacterium P01_A01_bin.84]